MMRLVVHVDRLVLHGVAPSEQAALVQALQQELQRQLAEPDALERWARLESRARMQIPSLAPSASPGALATPGVIDPAAATPTRGAARGTAMARHLATEVR